MGVIDEIRGDADLCAHVAELCKSRVEESVLFPERLFIVASVSFLDLVSHVGICDFWNRRAVE